MVHRNTYINGADACCAETWQTRARPDLFFAGQISGVEGYVESAASGLHGRAATPRRWRAARGRRAPPRTTAIGALAYYVSHADPRDYQPTNITFGIMDPPPAEARGRRDGRSRWPSARWVRWRPGSPRTPPASRPRRGGGRDALHGPERSAGPLNGAAT